LNINQQLNYRMFSILALFPWRPARYLCMTLEKICYRHLTFWHTL